MGVRFEGPKRGPDAGLLTGWRAWVFTLCMAVILTAVSHGPLFAGGAGTLEDPVVDSAMTREQAVVRRDGPRAPEEILNRQEVVKVLYRGFDGRVHRGQLVVDRRLAGDVREVFRIALQAEFPIFSVIPISHPRFGWDDDKSMAANNTSGFNYRTVTGGSTLSRHALGLAVDINPALNPYIRGGVVLPEGAEYVPGRPGTLTPDSPVVQAFLRLGWTWGGTWESLKDYQHFQKDP